MQELNLPRYNFKIRESDKFRQIFDEVRKKFIVLTPEEWVRQHFINYLITHLSYPKSLIKVEFGIKYNQLSKRPDILIYSSTGKPLLIIECKAPKIKLTKSVLEQVSVYNKVIKSPYVIVTNGMQHICWRNIFTTNEIDFLQEIPDYHSVK